MANLLNLLVKSCIVGIEVISQLTDRSGGLDVAHAPPPPPGRGPPPGRLGLVAGVVFHSGCQG